MSVAGYTAVPQRGCESTLQPPASMVRYPSSSSAASTSGYTLVALGVFTWPEREHVGGGGLLSKLAERFGQQEGATQACLTARPEHGSI